MVLPYMPFRNSLSETLSLQGLYTLHIFGTTDSRDVQGLGLQERECVGLVLEADSGRCRVNFADPLTPNPSVLAVEASRRPSGLRATQKRSLNKETSAKPNMFTSAGTLGEAPPP